MADNNFPTKGGATVPGVVPLAVNSDGEVVLASPVPSDASGSQPSLNGLNLLATIAASVARQGGYFIQNQSASMLTAVFDDGAGNALTVILLDPSAYGANRQGASIDSSMGLHQGRIRIYGLASSQFALRTW